VLSALIATEVATLPPFGRAKLLASTLLIRSGHLAQNAFLREVSRNPQNYSERVAVGLAYFFEDEVITIQRQAAALNTPIATYDETDRRSEKLYLYMRGCQIWIATFATAVVLKTAPAVIGTWKLLYEERSKCLRAMQYLEGNLSFGHGLNGIHPELLTTHSIVSVCNDVENIPRFVDAR
jgi:hypothetical protein